MWLRGQSVFEKTNFLEVEVEEILLMFCNAYIKNYLVSGWQHLGGWQFDTEKVYTWHSLKLFGTLKIHAKNI